MCIYACTTAHDVSMTGFGISISTVKVLIKARAEMLDMFSYCQISLITEGATSMVSPSIPVVWECRMFVVFQQGSKLLHDSLPEGVALEWLMFPK